MTREQGKPLKEAIGEVDYANGFVSWYAEEAKRVYGETIPASHTQTSASRAETTGRRRRGDYAVGLTAAMITRKIGPALAAGCTAVVKPAKPTLDRLKVGRTGRKSGNSKGVLNVITGN